MTDEMKDQVLTLDQLLNTEHGVYDALEAVRSPAEKALILAHLTVQLVELDMDERDANGDA